MSIAHTSYKSLWLSLVAMNSTDNPNPGYQQSNRVLLDLLQPLQLVLDLHIDLRLMNTRVQNDSPYAKALSFTQKTKPIHPVLHLQINLRLTKVVPKLFPILKKPGVRHINQVSSIARSKVTII